MNFLKKCGLVLSSLVILLGISFLLLPKHTFAYKLKPEQLNNSLATGDKISNATTVDFIDRGHIKVTISLNDQVFSDKSLQNGNEHTVASLYSGIYTDNNPKDSTYEWVFKGKTIISGADGVYIIGKIKGKNAPNVGASEQEIKKWLNSPDGLKLTLSVWNKQDAGVLDWNGFDTTYDINLLPATIKNYTNAPNFNILYAYSNNQIVYVGDTKNIFVYCEGNHSFQQDSCGSGTSLITDDSWNNKSTQDITALFQGDGYVIAKIIEKNSTKSAYIAKSGSQSSNLSGGNGSSNSDTQPIDINCEWEVLNPLTWFLCPLIKGGAQIISKLDQEINNRLTIEVGPGSDYDETAPPTADNKKPTGQGVYSAWSSMRTIALSLLVVIALVMVISQAISAGPFDAYTVKKVLPRIVISVILISLSWELTKLMIAISNDLGKGIGTLLSKPFENIGNNPTVSGGGFKGTAIGVVGTIGVLFAGLDLLAIGSFLLVGIAAVLIAFLVIAFRNILVMLLVILSPLALIAWILPNTQKAWKIWKDNFTAALLAFPLIIAFITSGRIFSKITSSRANPGLMDNIIIFIAYFGPYFALPLAFRLAGGAIASIGGIVNDRGKGFFDRNKKFRANRMAQNRADDKNFSRFNEKYALGRGANMVLGTGRNLKSLRRGRAGVRSARLTGQTMHGAEHAKSSAQIQANKGNDNFDLALASENEAIQAIAAQELALSTETDDDKRVKIQQDIRARRQGLEAARQVADRNNAGVRMAALERLAASGYQFKAGTRGYRQLDRMARDITGGDQEAFTRAMDSAQFNLKNSGRGDLAGINHGAGPDIKGGIRKLGNWGRGQSKIATYHGGAEAWLGASAVNDDGETAKDSASLAAGIRTSLANNETDSKSVLEWHSMLLRDYASATDGNKIEIQKQIDAIESIDDPTLALGRARNRAALTRESSAEPPIDDR